MRPIFLSLIILTTHFGFGQVSPLEIQKSAKGVYVQHKVAPKENWYSVGRVYFISPKEIASYNDLSMEKGLGISQLLNIPLTAANFTSLGASGTPVVYKVKQKEGLIKIAADFGVDIGQLRKLNQLSSDNLKVGSMLVLGHLVSNSSSLASAVSTSSAVSAPAVVVPAIAATPQQPAKTNDARSQYSYRSPTGYFLNVFQQQAAQGKEQRMEQPAFGVFKSSSGWQDGKYYVLMNGVVPGTVIKLSSNKTDKTIYAKVLGAVPQGKESEGLVLRISNAAASILGVENDGAIGVVWYN
ncbi:MAG: LysM peptidoglycan-binding domain-containing protein [Bacteroidota bacterium]